MGVRGSQRRCACRGSSPINFLFRCSASWALQHFLSSALQIWCFSRIFLLRCTSSSRFNILLTFCTTIPEFHWNSPRFPRFPFFLKISPPFLPFCTDICGVFLGIFHCGPKMAMGRPVQRSKHTGKCTQLRTTHTMVPTGSVKNCKKSQTQNNFVCKVGIPVST